MGLTLVGAMMVYGSIRLDEMVLWQQENAWGIFVQPLAFFLFFTAAIAETKRIPFDLPEAESELVSGYFTEYSGMKFGMFYFAEYMEIATSSMLLVTIFLGGWNLPFLHRDGIWIAFGDNALFQSRGRGVVTYRYDAVDVHEEGELEEDGRQLDLNARVEEPRPTHPVALLGHDLTRPRQLGVDDVAVHAEAGPGGESDLGALGEGESEHWSELPMGDRRLGLERVARQYLVFCR
jgi:hypothetical protein